MRVQIHGRGEVKTQVGIFKLLLIVKRMLVRMRISKIRVPGVSQQLGKRFFRRALLPGSQSLAEVLGLLLVLVRQDAA